MDGLLIDSEPLWKEAADELLLSYGKKLSAAQYARTTGLRTKEFLAYWLKYFQLPVENIAVAETRITDRVTELIKTRAKPMPGVDYIFNFFLEREFKIGLATSSPLQLVNVVANILGIGPYLQAVASAQDLAYGKPHPEVYLICAEKLGARPDECICFEDSFNGMIAVKAARMKCVIVPDKDNSKNAVWETADLKISTLHNFNELLINSF